MMISKARDFDFSLTAISADSDWGRCMSSYLSQIQRKSGSLNTQWHYCAMLEHFYSIEPRRLPQLYSRADVDSFITLPSTAIQRPGQVKPGTMNVRLTALASFYHYAANYGVTGKDGMLYPLFPYLSPCSGVRRGQRAQSGNKALTDDELRRFFAVIPRDTLRGKRDFALFSFYFFCARRSSEIIALKWGDIEQTLIVDSTGSRLAWTYCFRGKGRKGILDRSELPPVAAAALFAYIDARGIRDTIQDDDYLFTSLPDYRGRLGYDPKRPLVASTVWQVAKCYARSACIDERRVTIHCFRHTSARAKYAAGASIREVQQLLRHNNISTTDIYLRELISIADPTIDRLHQFANL